VDFAYLEGFMAGDESIVNEVLDLFRQQAEAWPVKLDPGDPGWRDVVHTIKGSARGIGANALGDLCAAAEAQGPSGLPALKAGLDAALTDIAAYQARE
jgi:HPt (histidine-containing phosphotransfer) domain-containing protein